MDFSCWFSFFKSNLLENEKHDFVVGTMVPATIHFHTNHFLFVVLKNISFIALALFGTSGEEALWKYHLSPEVIPRWHELPLIPLH